MKNLKTCPCCKTYHERLVISVTGDEVCVACAKSDESAYLGLDEVFVGTRRIRASAARLKRLFLSREDEGECRLCGNSSCRKTQEGLLCQMCFMDVSRLEPGSYRKDRAGRVFEVLEAECAPRKARKHSRVARYPFGEVSCPRFSYPSTRTEWDAQAERMWALVEAHYNMAKSAVSRAVRTRFIAHSDYGEVLEDACLPALMRAALTYDESMAKFSTYGYTACTNAVRKWVKRRKDSRVYEEISEVPTVDPGSLRGSLEVLDYLKSNALSDEDLYAMEQHFLHGRTLHDIGLELGVGRQAIYLRIKRAQKRCLEAISRYED